MSRTLRNRKRPDSVRVPAVPGLSKHPIITARSVSAGPHSAKSSYKCATPKPATSTSAQSTPALNKKSMEKIPSISAQSESSNDDEEEDGSATNTKKQTNNFNNEDDDEDDDDSDRDPIRKRSSVIKHEYISNTDWPPSADGGGLGIGGSGSIQTKNISTKMATGMRVCKATGRNIIRMLSSSSPVTTRRNSKTSCSHKSEEAKVNKEGTYLKLNKNKVVVVDGTRVKLQIWDTAGQERFRSVTHAYYRDAHALLLLYDVTNKTTYDNIRAWLCEIRDCAQEDVVIVLIGNKSDCSSSDRQVKREDGERLAREHNVPFMETSAKTGLNVELAFQTVARQLKNRGYENGDDGKFNVHEFVRDNTKAKSICAQCSF